MKAYVILGLASMLILSSCKRPLLTQGKFFSEESAEGGEQTVAVFTESIFFKKENKADNDLQPSEKCLILASTQEYALAEYEKTATNNVRIEFQEGHGPTGCAFSEGYVLSRFVIVKDSTGPETVEGATIPSVQSAFYGFRYPTSSNDINSKWCKNRNALKKRYPSASSPHIGQDYRTVTANKKSLALSDGKITGMASVGACGWEVNFVDKKGAKWRYLHLNNPTGRLHTGKKVKAGTVIGIHSAYPTKGCGSGPHLHMERHSAYSGLKEKQRYENYGHGAKNCRYDPNTPFLQKYTSTSLSLVDASDASQDESRCSSIQPTAVRAEPETSTASGLLASLKAEALSDGKVLLALSASLSDNKENLCGANNETRCISSVALYIKKPSGFERVFSDRNIRNTPISLTAEQGFCASANKGTEYVVTAITNSNEVLNFAGSL